MTTTIAEPNVYAEQLSTLMDSLPGRRLPWVRHLRTKAMEDFVALGFPTTKLESWRFTNVAPIQRMTFTPAPDRRRAIVCVRSRWRNREVHTHGASDGIGAQSNNGPHHRDTALNRHIWRDRVCVRRRAYDFAIVRLDSADPRVRGYDSSHVIDHDPDAGSDGALLRDGQRNGD